MINYELYEVLSFCFHFSHSFGRKKTTKKTNFCYYRNEIEKIRIGMSCIRKVIHIRMERIFLFVFRLIYNGVFVVYERP